MIAKPMEAEANIKMLVKRLDKLKRARQTITNERS